MRIEDKGTGSTASEVSLVEAKFELEKWKAEEEVKLRRGEPIPVEIEG